MTKYPLVAALTLAWALAPGAAIADSSAANLFSFSGFGTLGLARTDTDQAIWVQNIQIAGAAKNFDYKTDSKLALQGTVSPTEWLSGTAQLLSEQRYGPNVSTEFEWAFIKLRPLPGLSLRGGELELPTFLISDVRNVGYSNLWLRAPDDVYGQPIFDVYRGYDLTYQHAVGPYSLSLNALAGATLGDTALAPGEQLRINGRHLFGYSLTLDMNVVTVRVSRVTTARTRELYGITHPELSWSFDSIGAAYDHDDVILQSEFIERRTHDPSINVNGMYLLAGYRLGKWTPFVILARGVTVGGGDGTVPFASEHNAALGVRLDAFKNVDFKAQVEHATAYVGGTPFENQSPTFNNVGNVFSFLVDFVF